MSQPAGIDGVALWHQRSSGVQMKARIERIARIATPVGCGCHATLIFTTFYNIVLFNTYPIVINKNISGTPPAIEPFVSLPLTIPMNIPSSIVLLNISVS